MSPIRRSDEQDAAPHGFRVRISDRTSRLVTLDRGRIMTASCGKIIGAGILVLTLHADLAARGETAEIRPGEAAMDRTGASVAAVMPHVQPLPMTDGAKDPPQDPRGVDAAPADAPRDPGPDASARPGDGAAPAAEGTAPAEAGTSAADAPFSREAIAAALRARLEARSEPGFAGSPAARSLEERQAIAAFYTGRDFAPLWFELDQPIAAVEPAIARLRRAAEDALDLSAFPLPSTQVGTAEAVAEADIAVTDAVVAYGRQASGSRVDPSKISRLIGARPEVADAAIVLALVATAGERAGTVLRSFNPPHAPYVALRAMLEEHRRHRTPAAPAASIPKGPVLRVGMRDPRVPLVRARLSLDETTPAAGDSLYDTQVAAAVASFQKAHGLTGSGLLTAQTVAVLSDAHASRLEAEIIANMERWRWMPRDLGASRIEVNIPDFEAVVVENETVVERHRVVVGKEKTPTPIFSEEMRYLIVNPYWNVPPSIIKNELTSADGHLLRRGYESFYRNGQLVVRQPPGERNALGRIKFMFPNAYSVYLHDTPSRALFSEARRAYSHGCVRVDDPFRFAETVLGKGWSEARLRKLIGGKERYVTLPKALPIHIQYFTAYVDNAGELQTREDIYGYSRRVRAALGLDG
jgi:murein L,D-transpeptidase YcbB/YkuD